MPFRKKLISVLTTLAIMLSIIAPLGVSASGSAIIGHASFVEYENSCYFSSTSPYNGSYYNQLNTIQKKLYNAMKNVTPEQTVCKVDLEQALSFTSRTENYTLADAKEVMAAILSLEVPVFFAYMWDNPLVFIYDTFTYGFDDDQIEGKKIGSVYKWTVKGIAMDLHLDDAYKENPQSYTNAVKQKIDAFSTNKINRYAILKDIHNYLCENVYYDAGAIYAHEPYGALVEGRAVCEGYAEAFKLLCDKYNIPCALVIGEGAYGGSSEGHMWNAVQMENGYWYGVDVTWDDQTNICYDFFLAGTYTVAPNFGYITFGNSHIEDEEILNYPNIHNTEYVDPCKNGHTPGEWTVTQKANYLKDGQRVKKCTVCGEITAVETIPKLNIPAGLKLKENSRLKVEIEYLAGIKEKVTVAELQNEFDGPLLVIDRDGNALSANSYVGTGCKILVNDKLLSVYVLGDINGDGIINPVDALRIKRIILMTLQFTPEELKAACISGRNYPSPNDYLKVKKHILQTYDIFGQS